MSTFKTIPNPDLAVGADNKQRWNQPQHRRHGFHNAHTLFRRGAMFRARSVLVLEDALDNELAARGEVEELTGHDAFSALVVARENRVWLERCADDFSPHHPHSIQSVTKMHIHLIAGDLVEQGVLDLSKPVSHYLPGMGLGYADASVQDLLDMNVVNDFSEDYSDPLSDCYTEEIALGWRLPEEKKAEPSLEEFAYGITGTGLTNTSGHADYKSANTDVLTLLCSRVSDVPLHTLIGDIVDAAGYEGAFYISTSSEHLPAFSGGGCLSARDLARFGLLFARRGFGVNGHQVGSAVFINNALLREAPCLEPPRNWMRYSNHLMTDGRFLGHAGYGGQFLMADMQSGAVAAYLSVLENEAGYDDDYLARVVQNLTNLLRKF
ncbi:MAG: serine hydrolase domain-containing protein [Hyphomicrobiales bacterium]